MDLSEETAPKLTARYEIKSFIDSGSTCSVYKVSDKKNSNEFAAKVILRKFIEDHNLILSIEQEIRVHKLIDHPHISKIYDVIYEKDCIIILLDYCPKGDLFNIISDTNLRVSYIIHKLIVQILDAINYLHERKIYHKDIKPENILITNTYDCMITDFGCCQTPVKRFRPERYASIEYAPPEFFTTERQDGEKFDVWSIGVLFYVMISGHTPWGHTDPDECINDILTREIDYSDIPEVPKELIQKCLIKDPKERATISQLMETSFYHNCLERYQLNMAHAKGSNSVGYRMVAADMSTIKTMSNSEIITRNPYACVRPHKVPRHAIGSPIITVGSPIRAKGPMITSPILKGQSRPFIGRQKGKSSIAYVPPMKSWIDVMD